MAHRKVNEGEIIVITPKSADKEAFDAKHRKTREQAAKTIAELEKKGKEPQAFLLGTRIHPTE